MSTTCNHCGREVENVPLADYCAQCPPRRCDDCGEMYSMTDLCKCWISIDEMDPADVKALFAADGTFNVGIDGLLSVAEPLEQ